MSYLSKGYGKTITPHWVLPNCATSVLSVISKRHRLIIKTLMQSKTSGTFIFRVEVVRDMWRHAQGLTSDSGHRATYIKIVPVILLPRCWEDMPLKPHRGGGYRTCYQHCPQWTLMIFMRQVFFGFYIRYLACTCYLFSDLYTSPVFTVMLLRCRPQDHWVLLSAPPQDGL